jgi:hypothetical protein
MTEELYKLLTELIKRTYSPRDSKEFIDKYCISTLDLTDIAQFELYKKLSIFCNELIEKKKQEGYSAIQKRQTNKLRQPKIKKDWFAPRFYSDFDPDKFNGEILCYGCKKPIVSNNVFKWYRTGKYDVFCPIPSCWRDEESDLFEKDFNYRKFVLGK